MQTTSRKRVMVEGVVDACAVSAAACHAGGPGSIPSRGQTYVKSENG
jgi:hypothetical protein